MRNSILFWFSLSLSLQVLPILVDNLISFFQHLQYIRFDIVTTYIFWIFGFQESSIKNGVLFIKMLLFSLDSFA